MNRYVILLLIVFSHNTKAQHKVDIVKLKQAYEIKDDEKFLSEFPKNFIDFKSTFGWNDKLDKPNVLYNDSNEYIDYFLSYQLKILLLKK